MKSETINVEGMSCSHCTGTVENALRILGVTAKADLSTGTVQVDFDEESTSLQKLKDAINTTGYTAL